MYKYIYTHTLRSKTLSLAGAFNRALLHCTARCARRRARRVTRDPGLTLTRRPGFTRTLSQPLF